MIAKQLIAVLTALTLNSGAIAEATAGPVKKLVSTAAVSVGGVMNLLKLADRNIETYDVFQYEVIKNSSYKKMDEYGDYSLVSSDIIAIADLMSLYREI